MKLLGKCLFLTLASFGIIVASIIMPILRSYASSGLFFQALKLYTPNVLLYYHQKSCMDKILEMVVSGNRFFIVLINPTQTILKKYLDVLPTDISMLIFGNISVCTSLDLSCLKLSHSVVSTIGVIGGPLPYNNTWRPIISSIFVPSVIGIIGIPQRSIILSTSIGPKGKLFPAALYFILNHRKVIFAPIEFLNPYILAANHELAVSMASWSIFLLGDCCRTDLTAIVCSFNNTFNFYNTLSFLLNYYNYQLHAIEIGLIRILGALVENDVTNTPPSPIISALRISFCKRSLYELPVLRSTSCGNMYDYGTLEVALYQYAYSLIHTFLIK